MGEEVSVADLAQDEEQEEVEYMEFDPYAFIKSLPPLEQCAPTWRRALLPKQTRNCKRKTLVRTPRMHAVISIISPSGAVRSSLQTMG
jgi:hypothetical protein